MRVVRVLRRRWSVLAITGAVACSYDWNGVRALGSPHSTPGGASSGGGPAIGGATSGGAATAGAANGGAAGESTDPQFRCPGGLLANPSFERGGADALAYWELAEIGDERGQASVQSMFVQSGSYSLLVDADRVPPAAPDSYRLVVSAQLEPLPEVGAIIGGELQARVDAIGVFNPEAFIEFRAESGEVVGGAPFVTAFPASGRFIPLELGPAAVPLGAFTAWIVLSFARDAVVYVDDVCVSAVPP